MDPDPRPPRAQLLRAPERPTVVRDDDPSRPSLGPHRALAGSGEDLRVPSSLSPLRTLVGRGDSMEEDDKENDAMTATSVDLLGSGQRASAQERPPSEPTPSTLNPITSYDDGGRIPCLLVTTRDPQDKPTLLAPGLPLRAESTRDTQDTRFPPVQYRIGRLKPS